MLVIILLEALELGLIYSILALGCVPVLQDTQYS